MIRLPKLTIRQRLPLLISLTSLAVLMLEGYFIYQYSIRFCQHEFRERIEKRIAEADTAIMLDQAHPNLAISHLPPTNLPDESVFFISDTMEPILADGKMPIDTGLFHQCKICFVHVGEREYGFRHDTATHQTLVVSAIDRYGATKLQNLRVGIISGILLSVLLLACATWLWVKKMLLPIANKIRKAQIISSQNLNMRLDVKNNHDELGQLAMTINEMLDRIELGFRAQQQFIRHASHEMRTPLSTIRAELDLALQRDREPAEYRAALENVRERAEFLNELVSKLLVLARLESGITLYKKDCAIDEALFNSINDLKAKYPNATITIDLDITAPDADVFTIKADLTILRAAIFNLLDNAYKYGAGKPISVSLAVSDAGEICLEIADQGPGLPPDELQMLFEPFYRSKSHTDLAGSGIGLSLVRAIAEKLGGAVHLDSTLGKGTKAIFRFPKQS